MLVELLIILMSMNIEKLSSWIVNVEQSIASIVKIILQSKCISKATKSDKSREIVILGNGPSLNSTISQHRDFLMQRDRLAVNFAANAPVFFELKPNFYVLADNHFFCGYDSDKNVQKLWENFTKINWKIQLFVPAKYRRWLTDRNLPQNIIIKTYNLTPVEGFKSIRKMMYDFGLGMPRPRNVLIPSIMLSLWSGYGKIYIAGADHSWTQTLWVDEQNRVVSIQPHFYEDNEEERKRVATEYHNYPLHQILQSLYIAFRSYFDIADYAKTRSVEIFNITPESFIDAFPRLKL